MSIMILAVFAILLAAASLCFIILALIYKNFDKIIFYFATKDDKKDERSKH
jgi:hypothetical protein